MPEGASKPSATTDGVNSAGGSEERYEFDADRGFAAVLADGLGDIGHAAKAAPIWLTLGWWDFKRQTRRTVLGPLWSIVGTGVTVAVLGYVYSSVLNMEKTKAFPYIAAGLVLWFFIAGSIQGGLSVYVSARGVLTERSLPIAFSAFRFVIRYFVELILKFVVFAVAAILVSLPITENILWALPGLLILVANGLWVVLALGPLGARFRDVSQIVSPLMLIAFLASPVLWPQGMLGSSEIIALLNPFTHFLAIVRDPLLGSAPPMLSVIVTLCITGVGWLVAVMTHCVTKDRVVFWL